MSTVQYKQLSVRKTATTINFYNIGGLSGEFLSSLKPVGVLSRGVNVRQGLCPGFYVQGGYVLHSFLLIPQSSAEFCAICRLRHFRYNSIIYVINKKNINSI